MISFRGLTHRESLGYWLNEQGLVGDGVEVGAAFGQYASRILSVWKGKKLLLVDPWENLSTEEYPEKHDTANFDAWHRECQQLAATDSRAWLMKYRSKEALPLVPDLSLDFAYIDANHEYRHVLDDMEGWFKKVKHGGLLGGHDFYTHREGGAFCEVAAAVMRWTAEHNLPFLVTPTCTSWWCLKE